jgi:hypothetical protein
LSHQNTTWLEVFAGEIVHTDGIVQRANYMNIPQPINGFGQRININRGFGQFGTDVFGRHAAYAVVNSSGIKGCALLSTVPSIFTYSPAVIKAGKLQ